MRLDYSRRQTEEVSEPPESSDIIRRSRHLAFDLHLCLHRVVSKEMGIPVTTKSSVAVILIGLFLGIGNPGAWVVCFGADGHIEVVPSSEDHCCECPSHSTLGDATHRCEPCFDVPLPLGTVEAFLIPAGGKVQDLRNRAESAVRGGTVTHLSPRPTAAPPGTASCAPNDTLSSLSSVVLLI